LAGKDKKAKPDKDLKPNSEKFWDALEDWEKKWTEERKTERKEEAKKIREAEEEYQRFSRSQKVLEPAKKAKDILATKSIEPSLGKMRLQKMESFPENQPFEIDRIDYDKKDFIHHPIRIIPKIEPEKKCKAHEYCAYSLRKALEFQTNEKINVILEASGPREFLIKALEGAEFVPLCRIFASSQDHIEIEIKKSSFPYIHGYSFDIEKIVYNYLAWLQTYLPRPDTFTKK